jgi:gluconate kinase
MHVKYMKSSSTLGVGSDVTDVTDVAMIVVFGRPGAGKSSVAEEAVRYIYQRGQSDKGSAYDCLALDLDTCVPKWMKDNFAKGVYPTHEERLQFAHSACDYVEAQCRSKQSESKDNHPISVIVSFSFVNTDLREVYRSRFPTAIWALVDTTEEEATVRINQREGHFYKGAPPAVSDDPPTIASDGTFKDSSTEKNNSEWMFAPVTFHHIILNGEDSVTANAVKVLNELDSLRAKREAIISSESEI